MIDKQALAQDLYSLAPVGALPKGGGVTRLAFSPEEAELHQRVSHWLTDLGAKVKKTPSVILSPAGRAKIIPFRLWPAVLI